MMLKKIGYGLILWVIPYVKAIPLMGLMQTDLIFFQGRTRVPWSSSGYGLL